MLHSRAANPIVACKKKINIFYLINNKKRYCCNRIGKLNFAITPSKEILLLLLSVLFQNAQCEEGFYIVFS